MLIRRATRTRAQILARGGPIRVNPNTDQSRGLEFWWPFADRHGKRVREVVRDHHATWTSTVPDWQSNLLPRGAGMGRCLRIATASNSNTHIDTAAFTGWDVNNWAFAAWCSLNSNAGNPRLFSLSGRQLEIYFETLAGNDQLRVYNGSTEIVLGDVSTPGVAETGELLHVVVTRRPDGNTYGYINGISLGSGVAHTYSSLDGQTMRLGGINLNNLADWIGHIADMRLWIGRCLYDGDVRSLYNPLSRWDLYAPEEPQIFFIPQSSGINITPDQGNLALSSEPPTAQLSGNHDILVPAADLALSSVAPLRIVDEILTVPQGGLQINEIEEAVGVNFATFSDYLSRGADLTGGTTGLRKICISFWFVQSVNSRYVFRNDNPSTQAAGVFTAPFGSTVGMRLRLGKSTAGDTVDVTVNGALFGPSWNHIVFSVDTSTGKTEDDVLVYVNGQQAQAADLSFDFFEEDTAFDFTATDWWVAKDPNFGNGWNSDMADLYVALNSAPDLSDSAELAKFYASGWVPLADDLPSAILRFEGAVASWHTNKGTGGGFTKNGSLVAASSDPQVAPPLVQVDNEVPVPQGDLALSATTPTAATTENHFADPLQGNLLINADAPGVVSGESHSRVIPQADLLLSTVAAVLEHTTSENILVPAGVLVLDSAAPTPYVSANITVLSGDLTLSTSAPGVNGTLSVPVPAGTLVLNGEAPVPYVSANITVPAGDLLLTSQNPSVVLDQDFLIVVPAGEIVLATLAPVLLITGGTAGEWTRLISPGESDWVAMAKPSTDPWRRI